MELGSGSGKQVEVVAKLHPNVCYFLFDMPPQLYLCEPFLLRHYEEFLPNFERIDMRPALEPVSTHQDFDDSFWVRRPLRNRPGPA